MAQHMTDAVTQLAICKIEIEAANDVVLIDARNELRDDRAAAFRDSRRICAEAYEPIAVGIQREGSAIRAGDSSGTLVTINQITPIYVNFALPQKLFPALQSASGRGGHANDRTSAKAETGAGNTGRAQRTARCMPSDGDRRAMKASLRTRIVAAYSESSAFHRRLLHKRVE